MQMFAWPRVGRAGLGNALLPWARAELFASQSGARVLAPDWTSFRLGPYLRREADKRSYGGFFFSADHVSGSRKLMVRLIARRVREGDPAIESYDGSLPLLIEFAGLGELFAPLLGHAAFIRQRLWQMTVARFRRSDPDTGSGFVAMHVRRGDITRQGFGREELAGVKQYTPLSWYIGMADAIRASPSLSALPIFVFTDGYPQEIAELTRVPGVQLRGREPAIADLWTMSRASLLFASGFSTFSMWVSYLGGMPTIYAPGKLAQRVLGGREDAVEIELSDEDPIPAAVLKVVASRGSPFPFGVKGHAQGPGA